MGYKSKEKLNTEVMEIEDVIKWMHLAFTKDVFHFMRPLLPVLEPEVYTVPIPPSGYTWIKKEEKSILDGTRQKFYTCEEEMPPEHVKIMTIKEQLMWEWRYKALLRKQRRLSFWISFTGLSITKLSNIAIELGVKFGREIQSVKAYRDRYAVSTPKSTVKIKIAGEGSFQLHWLDIINALTECTAEIEKGTVLNYYEAVLSVARGRSMYVVEALNENHAELLLCVKLKRTVNIMSMHIFSKYPFDRINRRRDHFITHKLFTEYKLSREGFIRAEKELKNAKKNSFMGTYSLTKRAAVGKQPYGRNTAKPKQNKADNATDKNRRSNAVQKIVAEPKVLTAADIF